MTGLPEDLAGPLHIDPPTSWGTLLLALLALSLLAWWLRRRRRARTSDPAAAAAGEPVPAATPPSDLEQAIRHLGRHYRHRAREGCHELSALLRSHYAGSVGPEWIVATARELLRQHGDNRLTRLLMLLSDLQFGRRPPDSDDLAGACELAIEVVRSGAERP